MILCPLRLPVPFNLIYYLKEFAFFPQGEGKTFLFKLLLCLLQLII